MSFMESLGFGGGSGGSGPLSAALSFAGDNYMMEDQQSFNAKQAEYNRAWQEKMANTAYQRAAKDLEAAGLNRILALGSPAATPGGAMAQSGLLPGGSSAMQAASSAVNATSNARSANQNIEESKQRIANLQKTAEKIGEEIINLQSSTELNQEKKGLTAAQTSLASAEAAKQNVLKTLYKAAEPMLKDLASVDKEKVKKKIDEYSAPVVNYVKEKGAHAIGSDVSDLVLDVLVKTGKFIGGALGLPDPDDANNLEPVFEFSE